MNQLLENRKPSVVAYPPTDRFGAPLSESEITERAKQTPLRILFLGNVTYRKGLHTLLNALAFLSPLPYTLDVVGSLHSEPVYTKLIQELITKHSLSSVVVFHGSLDKDPLTEKLEQAHLLAVPSSYEGFGIVYLEGMGFGLPAIGTTAGAAGEVIEHGKTGLLIEPDDSRALAEHLKTLMEDRASLTRLSLNARARYLHQPSWTETAGNVREFLLTFL